MRIAKRKTDADPCGAIDRDEHLRYRYEESLGRAARTDSAAFAGSISSDCAHDRPKRPNIILVAGAADHTTASRPATRTSPRSLCDLDMRQPLRSSGDVCPALIPNVTGKESRDVFQ